MSIWRLSRCLLGLALNTLAVGGVFAYFYGANRSPSLVWITTGLVVGLVAMFARLLDSRTNLGRTKMSGRLNMNERPHQAEMRLDQQNKCRPSWRRVTLNIGLCAILVFLAISIVGEVQRPLGAVGVWPDYTSSAVRHELLLRAGLRYDRDLWIVASIYFIGQLSVQKLIHKSTCDAMPSHLERLTSLFQSSGIALVSILAVRLFGYINGFALWPAVFTTGIIAREFADSFAGRERVL